MRLHVKWHDSDFCNRECELDRRQFYEALTSELLFSVTERNFFDSKKYIYICHSRNGNIKKRKISLQQSSLTYNVMR